MPLTPLPTAPSRADPANFSTRADAMMAALPVMVTEFNAALPAIEQARTVANDVAGARSDCQAYAAAAAQSAALAAAVSAGSAGGFPALRPALLLDFASSERVDPRLTFTRASAATRINAIGMLETVAANVPRIDFDPLTLACRGLLMEPAKTNRCKHSATFDEAAWVASSATKTTGIADPWGGTTAATVSATAANGTIENAGAVITAGLPYTVSCWIRRRTGTGAVGIRVVEAANTVEVPVTTSWARFSATMTATQTTGRCGVFVRAAGDEVDVWGFQLEFGTWATSYIATTTAEVTRSEDLCSMSGAAFSSWFHPTEGTLIVDGYSVLANPDVAVAAELYAADSDRITIAAAIAGNGKVGLGEVIVGGGSQCYLQNGTAWAGWGRVALAWAENNLAVSHDGAAAATDNAGSLPTPTTLSIGGRVGGSMKWGGHISRVAYYPRRLPNAQLQGLTA